MSWNEHQAKILEAVCRLIGRDSNLIDVEAHEVAITTQLAQHLSPEYREMDVDCEYNRHGTDPKKHPLQDNWIRPDILVHRRLTDTENTLVFEAKVHGNDDFENDFGKLTGMTDQTGDYRYDFGIHIHFQNVPLITFTVFEDGAASDRLSTQLNEAWAAVCAERGFADT